MWILKDPNKYFFKLNIINKKILNKGKLVKTRAFLQQHWIVFITIVNRIKKNQLKILFRHFICNMMHIYYIFIID